MMDVTKCWVSSLDVLRQALTVVTHSCSLFVGLSAFCLLFNNAKPALLDTNQMTNVTIEEYPISLHWETHGLDLLMQKNPKPWIFSSLFWVVICCLIRFALFSESEQREQLCTHQKSSCFYQQFHWQPHIQTKSTVTNRWCSILRMWVFLSYFIFFHLGFICPKIFSRTFLKQVLLQVFFGKCYLSLKPVVCVVKLLCSWGRLIYPEQW